MAFEISKKTISDQIVEHFKDQIESGQLKPGDEFPSERRLEKELGVSRKTINKAISILAGQGYLFKEQGKSTFVADFRKNVALPTGSLGIVFAEPAEIYHPARAPIFRTLCELVSGQGVRIIFDKVPEMPNFRRELEENHLHAAVFFQESANVLENIDIPIAVVSKYNMPFGRGISRGLRVYCDILSPLKRAVEYLYGLGHRRVGFLYGNSEWKEDMERIKLFTDMAAQLKLAAMPALPSFYERKQTVRELEALLRKKVTAVIAADDMVARWVIEELTARSIQVPGDISVIGFNDMEMYSLRQPQLTTYKLPAAQIAWRIYQFISAAAGSGASGTQDVAIDFDFCERESCASPCRSIGKRKCQNLV